MIKMFLMLTAFFTISAHSLISAEQNSMDIAKELCCKAMCEACHESSDAAFIFGKHVLNNLDTKIELKDVNHLKGCLCTSCLFCSPKNLEELSKIADEVVKFKHDTTYNAEIHIIDAWLIKGLLSIYNDNLEDALSYVNIADLLLKNYKHSELFDKEFYLREERIIKTQIKYINKHQE